ncbi:hypothetical protein TNCV_3193011 [Trichonephila clavipes]|nr:hypothetical protein TNCV_3193011 [Trichonephila clavipes]
MVIIKEDNLPSCQWSLGRINNIYPGKDSKNKAQFVRRSLGEKFHSDCVVQTVKHPTKIMIWSVISGKGTGCLYAVKGMMR